MSLELKNRLKNLWQNIKEYVKSMRRRLKWFAISFPVFFIGCAIMYFIARNRAEFNVDVATGIFFTGAIIASISVTVWNIKSNEIMEVQENG